MGKSKNKKNVVFVVQDHLCTCCGTCAGACPKKCISMIINEYGIYVPMIDKNSCNDCGLCVQVCPGHGFDYIEYQKRVHGKIPTDAALGAHIKTYAGYTSDRAILSLSQSGGFVSTILIYCLENGIIDGAAVTRWNEKSPFEPVTYIARDRESILAAVGSKYNPVPAAQILGELFKAKGRYAFVGTSCQIQGMRKAEKVFPKLADKIVVYIGLHCLGVFTYHFHDQILHKLKLKRKAVTYFHYRDKASQGWPGDMRLRDNQGQIYDMNSNTSKIWPRYCFTNWRCFLCFDKANEFSDISCGDCRIPDIHSKYSKKGFNTRMGLSDFVVRTERAACIVNEAIGKGLFSFSQSDSTSMVSSVGAAGKKIGLNTFIGIAKIFNSGIPEYGVQFSTKKIQTSWLYLLIKPLNILFSMQYYLFYIFGSQKIFRNFLKRFPHFMMGALNSPRHIFCDWAKFRKTPFLLRLYRKNDR